MVSKNLEGVESQVKEVKPTAETKGAKSTATEVKAPTVGITETEEFRKALDKALGKATESLNRQVSLSDANAQKEKAEAEEAKSSINLLQAELDDVHREQEELLRQQDDPEVLKAYKSRTSIATKERDFAQRETKLASKLQQAEEDAFNAKMDRKATEIMREYGIPLEDLKGSANEQELELRALKWKMAQEPKKEETEITQTFDSGVSTGAGGGTLTAQQVEKMSPEERFARADEIARIPMGYKPLA